jgi:hypothetical protein
MSRIGRQRYVPAEDRERGQSLSPVEALLAAAEPTLVPQAVMRTLDEETVFPPWEPTGDETPKKTVELDRESATDNTVPPPQTAGGAIPAAFARFRQYGPDES